MVLNYPWVKEENIFINDNENVSSWLEECWQSHTQREHVDLKACSRMEEQQKTNQEHSTKVSTTG